MMRILYLLPLGLVAACQSANVQYTKIGYGPELHVAKAQCDIMAMGVEQQVFAFGDPAFVLGAEIGNAIANEARKQQFMKNCMIIKGWGQPGQKPIKGAGPFPSAPKGQVNMKGKGAFPPAPKA